MAWAPSPTTSRTVRSRASFSASVVVGDSPVVPLITRPSLPCSSTRYAASFATPSRSSDRSSRNGVTMAVRRRPNGRRGAEAVRVIAHNLACRRPRLLSLPRIGAGCGVGAVGQPGDGEVADRVGRPPREVAQAGHGDPAHLDVGVLGGAYRHEVPPGAVVAGHDEAGLDGARKHRPRRLPDLLG